jgi:predicted DNA-binding transcriptional regulator YafY
MLAMIAATARDREIMRFQYSDYSGTASERRVEPYRLVNWGRRWYLVAFDLERDDWRTFRVDRLAEPRSAGHRFALRPLPAEDIAGYVAAKTRQVQMKVRGRVIVHAPAEEVTAKLGAWSESSVEPLGPDRCRVQLGGRSVEDIAFWLGILDRDFEVVDSPELSAAVRRVAERYSRAVA